MKWRRLWVLGLLMASGMPFAQGTVKKNIDDPIEAMYFSKACPVQKRALLVMLPGGRGHLKDTAHPDRPSANFLVRTYKRFHCAYDILLIGIRKNAPEGYRDHERTSIRHAQEVKCAIEKLNASGLPVFLVGTSRGTISAASLAQKLDSKGVILTATLVGELQSWGLTKLQKPVLFVHHRQDQCNVTPFHAAERLAASMGAAFISVEGGNVPVSRPCQAKSYHGFWGIEVEVVGAMEKWLEVQSL